MKNLLLLITTFVFVFGIVEKEGFSQVTNYDDPANWASHPMKGSSDMSFSPSYTFVNPDTSIGDMITVDYDTTSNYDLFCVHPTVLVEVGTPAHNITINAIYKLGAKLTIKWSFSQFSQFGRIYAPYYRQGTLATFDNLPPFPTSDSLQAEILETAADDIIAAFTYYMQNNNNGKKVILVGHSQGSYVLAMMLRVFEANLPLYQPYLDKIFLSVLVGMPGGPFVQNGTAAGGWWENIPVCQSPLDTACIMSWATYKDDGQPFSSIPTGNRVVFNNSLVSKGLMFTTFDSLTQQIIIDPLGFIPAKPVTYSVYPKASFFFPGTFYGVTTDFIAYADMYAGRISNPDPSNFGLVIDNIQGTGDLRHDPLDSSVTNNLHDWDMYVAIGDAVNLIRSKLDQGTTGTDPVPDGGEQIPNRFKLAQNYPNPFNPNTIINYAIDSKQYSTLKVYDILGKEVAELVNEIKPAGTYEAEFDASNLSSGIYYYQLRAGEFVQTKKMLLLK